MQAKVGQVRMENLLEYNKTLSFAESNAHVKLKMSGSMGKSMKETRLGLYFDAAWAVRPNGDSQGGYLIFVIKAVDEESGKPTLNILDYGSKKLPRKARSSLIVEVQAGRKVDWKQSGDYGCQVTLRCYEVSSCGLEFGREKDELGIA